MESKVLWKLYFWKCSIYVTFLLMLNFKLSAFLKLLQQAELITYDETVVAIFKQ